MIFGLTLLGALSGGIQDASGNGACTAGATGWAEVTRLASGSAVSAATLSGQGLRQHSAAVSTLSAGATCTGLAAATYQASSPILNCGAVVTGFSQVDFRGYGAANAAAVLPPSTGYRFVRAFCVPANAVATMDGTGWVFEIGYANTARAYAIGYGTTAILTYGQGVATAELTNYCVHTQGARGNAQAYATSSSVTPLHQQGGAGVAAASAVGIGDPVVTSGGVEYHEGNGVAECFITLEQTHVQISQAQLASAYAYAVGDGIHTIGGHGVAIATCTAYAAPLVYDTGATSDPAYSSCVATGQGVATFAGKGVGVATATLTDAAVVFITKAYGNTASAIASGQATAVLNSKANSTGTATATGTGTGYRTTKAKPLAGICSATIVVATTEIAVLPAVALFNAAISEMSNKTLIGALAPAVGTATVSGYNWVNAYGPGPGGIYPVFILPLAPAFRTVTLSAESRVVIIQEQVRQLAA